MSDTRKAMTAGQRIDHYNKVLDAAVASAKDRLPTLAVAHDFADDDDLLEDLARVIGEMRDDLAGIAGHVHPRSLTYTTVHNFKIIARVCELGDTFDGDLTVIFIILEFKWKTILGTSSAEMTEALAGVADVVFGS